MPSKRSKKKSVPTKNTTEKVTKKTIPGVSDIPEDSDGHLEMDELPGGAPTMDDVVPERESPQVEASPVSGKIESEQQFWFIQCTILDTMRNVLQVYLSTITSSWANMSNYTQQNLVPAQFFEEATQQVLGMQARLEELTAELRQLQGSYNQLSQNYTVLLQAYNQLKGVPQ